MGRVFQRRHHENRLISADNCRAHVNRQLRPKEGASPQDVKADAGRIEGDIRVLTTGKQGTCLAPTAQKEKDKKEEKNSEESNLQERTLGETWG